MTCTNNHRFRPTRTFVLAALLAIGLMAITSVPVFAQASGTWTSTGSLNLPRLGHTATLLLNMAS